MVRLHVIKKELALRFPTCVGPRDVTVMRFRLKCAATEESDQTNPVEKPSENLLIQAYFLRQVFSFHTYFTRVILERDPPLNETPCTESQIDKKCWKIHGVGTTRGMKLNSSTRKVHLLGTLYGEIDVRWTGKHACNYVVKPAVEFVYNLARRTWRKFHLFFGGRIFPCWWNGSF